jgi:hypothetical protein
MQLKRVTAQISFLIKDVVKVADKEKKLTTHAVGFDQILELVCVCVLRSVLFKVCS